MCINELQLPGMAKTGTCTCDSYLNGHETDNCESVKNFAPLLQRYVHGTLVNEEFKQYSPIRMINTHISGNLGWISSR